MDNIFDNYEQNDNVGFSDYILRIKERQETERQLLIDYLTAFKTPYDLAVRTADLLQDRFGSISEAVKCNFMGYSATGDKQIDKLLHLLSPLSRREQNIESFILKEEFFGVDDCMKHIIRLLQKETSEVCYVFYLSRSLQLYHYMRLTSASASHVEVDMRTLLAHCPSIDNCRLIVAHNHLFHGAVPSASDIEFTEKLRDTCAETGINFIDHIITYQNTGYGILSDRHYSV